MLRFHRGVAGSLVGAARRPGEQGEFEKAERSLRRALDWATGRGR